MQQHTLVIFDSLVRLTTWILLRNLHEETRYQSPSDDDCSTRKPFSYKQSKNK